MRLTSLKWPIELAARLGIALLVPVVTVGLLMLVVPRFTDLPHGVALRVGHTDLTESQLRARIEAIEALYGLGPPATEPARGDFTRELARSVAMSMVIDQAADERGVVVSDQAAQDAANQLITQRFGPNGSGQFATLLGQVGASMQNVLDEIKRQQRFDVLYQQVTAGIPEVTQEDARAEYERRRSDMVLPEKRRLANIVLGDQQEAEVAAQRARSGTDFAALAREVSTDPTTRDSGGDLGDVTRQDLDDEYGQAAFTAPVGQVFGPVRSEAGWNVGLVVAVARPAVPLSFEQMQESLRNRLRADRKATVWQDWLTQRFQQAHPVYAEPYRPTDPERGPAAGDASPETR
jgi:peptidyl-prolyl cis-trans isomerase C